MGGRGVVIRDDKGSFVAALAKNTAGISSPLVAEAMAAREAALFVHNLQVEKMIMEGDAWLVLSALQNMGESCSSPPGACPPTPMVFNYGHKATDAKDPQLKSQAHSKGGEQDCT